jgi:hypothetical protein
MLLMTLLSQMPTDQSVAATQFARHQAADYTVRQVSPSYGKIRISELFVVTSCPGLLDLPINIFKIINMAMIIEINCSYIRLFS